MFMEYLKCLYWMICVVVMVVWNEYIVNWYYVYMNFIKWVMFIGIELCVLILVFGVV